MIRSNRLAAQVPRLPYTVPVSRPALHRLFAAARFRLATVIVSLCALFFAQAAVAGYACEGPGHEQAVQMSDDGMPCAQAMAPTPEDGGLALCHTHCQSSSGAVDHSPSPTLLADYSHAGPVLMLAAALPPADAADLQATLLRASAGPPLAIAHCCFRI